MDIGYFEFNNHKIKIKKIFNDYLYIKEDKTSFTKNEKDLIKIVNNMLTINQKTSIFIKKIKLNNIYNLYYDTKSKNYFWIPENNIYNETDNKILNFNYNHQEELLYDNQYPNIKDKEFYKKLINFANKTIIIFLSSTIALSMNFPNEEKNETFKQEEITITKEKQNINEIIYIYDYKDVEEAIDKNPNLTEEEKNIIKSTKFIFDENYMYIDFTLVLERLQTLKIEYGCDFENPYTQGSYSILDNIIKLRSYTIKGSLQEFIHEYLHSLQVSHNSFLMELSNQFFTNEIIMRLYEEKLIEDCYFFDKIENGKISNSNKIIEYTESEKMNLLLRNSTFERGYMGYAGIYYVLAELLPEHALREFQFNPSEIEIIINGLEESDPNEDFLRIFNLIIEITDIRNYNYETNQWEYKQDITNVYNLLNELCKDIKGTYITENIEIMLNYMIDDSYMVDKEDTIANEYKILKEFVRNYFEDYYVLRLPKTYLSNIRKSSILVYKSKENGNLNYIEINEQFNKEYLEYMSINKNNNQIIIREKRMEG